MSNQVLTLPDKRQLGYAVEGEGKPVIYFHGTASSRLEILLLKEFAHKNQFKLIGIDRPGYGLSTFKARIGLLDFAEDVKVLTDYLKLSRFAVLSWSGGGPFALTYTSLFPGKVTRAVAVGSPALPFDASEAHNGNPLAKVAMKNRLLAMWGLKFFRKSILNANQDVDSYLKSRSGKNMVADWPKPDRKFFADALWLKRMYAAMAEGFKQESSVKTVFQEHQLFLKPWSESILRIPVGRLILWQGAQDKTCPVGNVQKIAQAVKGARVELFPDEGHCVLFGQIQNLNNELIM
jgi:pimeloyl-ACP methyl ester carboxylesterase